MFGLAFNERERRVDTKKNRLKKNSLTQWIPPGKVPKTTGHVPCAKDKTEPTVRNISDGDTSCVGQMSQRTEYSETS